MVLVVWSLMGPTTVATELGWDVDHHPDDNDSTKFPPPEEPQPQELA